LRIHRALSIGKWSQIKQKNRNKKETKKKGDMKGAYIERETKEVKIYVQRGKLESR